VSFDPALSVVASRLVYTDVKIDLFFRGCSLKNNTIRCMQKLEDNKMTFRSENSWLVQCLSLAALSMMTYLHLSTIFT
jgi:hypothetical protein